MVVGPIGHPGDLGFRVPFHRPLDPLAKRQPVAAGDLLHKLPGVFLKPTEVDVDHAFRRPLERPMRCHVTAPRPKQAPPLAYEAVVSDTDWGFGSIERCFQDEIVNRRASEAPTYVVRLGVGACDPRAQVPEDYDVQGPVGSLDRLSVFPIIQVAT